MVSAWFCTMVGAVTAVTVVTVVTVVTGKAAIFPMVEAVAEEAGKAKASGSSLACS
jgi:hypothetical protein